MDDLYVITEGWDGPVVAGPYTYDMAVRARSGMRRPWRMIWRRRHYCAQPAEFIRRDHAETDQGTAC